MTDDDVLACAHKAVEFGYGTLVMQAGEDYGIDARSGWPPCCGASRPRPRSPPHAQPRRAPGRGPRRLARGRRRPLPAALRDLGRRALPPHPPRPPGQGQRPPGHPAPPAGARATRPAPASWSASPARPTSSVAADIELFRDMDMDMIGVGPYLPHPATPLGQEFERRRPSGDWPPDQAPNTELMTCKVLALTRLVRPDANLPATTALSLINKAGGRAHGLQRGANVVMPNLTPARVARAVRDLPGEGRRARDGRGHQRQHRSSCSRRSAAPSAPAPAAAAPPDPSATARRAPPRHAERAGRPPGRPDPSSSAVAPFPDQSPRRARSVHRRAVSRMPIALRTVGMMSTSLAGCSRPCAGCPGCRTPSGCAVRPSAPRRGRRRHRSSVLVGEQPDDVRRARARPWCRRAPGRVASTTPSRPRSSCASWP